MKRKNPHTDLNPLVSCLEDAVKICQVWMNFVILDGLPRHLAGGRLLNQGALIPTTLKSILTVHLISTLDPTLPYTFAPTRRARGSRVVLTAHDDKYPKPETLNGRRRTCN